MKLSRLLLPAAWLAASLLGFAALLAWVRAVPNSGPPEPLTVGSFTTWSTTDSTTLAAWAVELRSHDPFRWSHRPSPVVYDPDAPAGNMAPPPRPPAPHLTISGIVGGPPWFIMVDGIPGHEGSTLLAVGKTVNGIRLNTVHGDTAFLAGLDTNWTLTTRRNPR